MAIVLKNRIKSLVFGTLLIAVLVFSFVLIEFNESRKELINTKTNEAINLSKSLSLSFETTLITNNEFENQIVSRLTSVAGLLTHLILKSKNEFQMNEILREYQIDFVANISKEGKVLFNTEKTYSINEEFIQVLEPIFSNDAKWIDLGIVDFELSERSLYLIAHKGVMANECVLVGVLAEKLNDFRKRIGIGKQIQEIAKNPDIVYLILQDNEGIITASKSIDEISSIEADSFLLKSLKSSEPSTRIIEYKGKNIFEAVNVIKMTDNSIILNRIGLSLDDVMSIQQKSMRRVALIGIGIFIVFSLIYVYVVTRKGFSELKEKHKKIQTYTDLVLDNMADAVISVDKDFKVNYFNKNASKIFGISINDSIGNSYLDLFNNDVLLIKESFELKRPLINKEIIFNLNNDRKILELSISFVLDKEDNIDLIIAIIKDLTDKKYLQQQVERKDKLSAMGELAAGVAHEIRNPLNSINVIAQRIQHEFVPTEDEEEYKKLVSIIRSEVLRVNNIIKQFLEYARPPKLNLELCQINDLLEDSISIVESEANQKSIRIIRDFSDNIQMNLDKEKMKQVFINLLKNSIDAINGSGRISVKTSINGFYLTLCFEDSGSGIPEEIKSKIFNLYFTTKSNGTGLGLSIVHQIINEHSGTIVLDSVIGKGTTFIIEIPTNII